jgi:hypothetical protein
MWADKNGKLQSLQTRRYENAKSFLSDLIKNRIGESGIPKGLRGDFRIGFKITSGEGKQNISVKKSISNLITTDDTAFSTN